MPLAQGDHKICSSCRQEFPLSGFDQNRAQRDGLHNQCRTCAAAARKKSQLKDLPRWREYQKSWNRKARYGLTDEEFARMTVKAGGRCEVCGDEPREPFMRLDIDHCHASGKVRGLLCRPCNTALGAVRDEPKRLLALIKYLEKHTGE